MSMLLHVKIKASSKSDTVNWPSPAASTVTFSSTPSEGPVVLPRPSIAKVIHVPKESGRGGLGNENARVRNASLRR